MELQKALIERRTVRRYKQQEVSKDALTYLVDMGRRAACTANSQPLRYCIVRTPALAKAVFDHTAWAAYIKPLRNPVWGKTAPQNFIAITGPRQNNSSQVNAGAAIQTMTLAAHEIGLGTCWIGAFNREEVQKILATPDDREILYLLAVGYPDECPVSEDVRAGENIKYYLDENDRLHVPKICADDLIEWN